MGNIRQRVWNVCNDYHLSVCIYSLIKKCMHDIIGYAIKCLYLVTACMLSTGWACNLKIFSASSQSIVQHISCRMPPLTEQFTTRWAYRQQDGSTKSDPTIYFIQQETGPDVLVILFHLFTLKDFPTGILNLDQGQFLFGTIKLAGEVGWVLTEYLMHSKN